MTKRKSRPLTYQQIKLENPCSEQLYLFKCLFGDVATITTKLATEHADQFDFSWAAHHLLDSDNNIQTWETEQAKFQKNEVRLINKRDKAQSTKDRDAVEARLGKLWAKRDRKLARLWAKLYIAEGSS